MTLHSPNVGDLPMNSDISQLVNVFNGTHDIGQVTLAPGLSAPSSSNFSLLAQSGSTLGVGSYSYQFTYITGQYQLNNTLRKTGETLVSSSLSITTTTNNTNVQITLQTTGLPTSAIAFNIYRTSVGGSDYKLVGTVKVGNATYTDSISDINRASQVPPTTNTTGTAINVPMFYSTGANYSISSANTYTQLPCIAGAGSVTGTPKVNGFHYGSGTGNASDLVCDIPGTYLFMVWGTLSGLNNDVIYDLVSRVYINSNGSNYVDDSSGIVGTAAFSGESGGNHGAPEGVYLMHQCIKTLGINDLIRIYAVIGEAPRTVNKFQITIIKIA